MANHTAPIQAVFNELYVTFWINVEAWVTSKKN